MNIQQLQTNPQNPIKKPGPKVITAIQTLTLEERLNTLADIIIERIFEERNKKTKEL